MAGTAVDSSAWGDRDASMDEGEGVLLMRMLVRIRTLEAKVAALETQVAANNASLLTIQTRLGVINALLHLW